MATREAESREAQAAREVGHTDVSRGVAAVVVAIFALVVCGVGLMELVRDQGDAGSPWSELRTAARRAGDAARTAGALAGNRALLAGMQGFEDRLEERSAVAERVLPPVQRFLTGSLGAGNDQVVLGRRGWLYFRPALDHVTGRGFLDAADSPPRPGPLRALADFGAQLA
jgi:alginate O-acetyltransferase complex protein AlgJ